MLRLSAPRYLASIKNSDDGDLWFAVLKEVFVNGSLTAKEISRLLESKYQISVSDTLRTITDLTVKHFLIGVNSTASAIQSQDKKREAKAKRKEESAVSQDLPLRLNFIKFLADERKEAVLEFAQKKLRHATDDTSFKVFNALVALDQDAHIQ